MTTHDISQGRTVDIKWKRHKANGVLAGFVRIITKSNHPTTALPPNTQKWLPSSSSLVDKPSPMAATTLPVSTDITRISQRDNDDVVMNTQAESRASHSPLPSISSPSSLTTIARLPVTISSPISSLAMYRHCLHRRHQLDLLHQRVASITNQTTGFRDSNMHATAK